MSFNSGEKVYAKWPGSSMYYKAHVAEIGSGDYYTVEFDDGARERLKGKYIIPEKRMRSKSPSRRSRSRSRSRGRSKSPSRSKAKASPSPSRRSPSRKSRSTSKTTSDSNRSSRAKTPTTPTRISARIAAQEIEKETVQRKESVVSQQRRDSPKKRSGSKGRQSEMLSKVKDILLGPVLILGVMAFVPVFFVALNVACGKKKCTIMEVPQIPTDLNRYVNPEVIGVFLAFTVLQVVLYSLPVGRIATLSSIKGGRRMRYRCNGLFTTIVCLALYGILFYLEQPITYAYNHFLQFLATSMAFGALFSIILYLKGRKVSSSERCESGNTGNFIVDIFNGRELNPHVGLFNIKFFFFNNFLLSWIIIILSMLIFDYQQSGKVNTLAIMVGVFQILCAITIIFSEEKHFAASGLDEGLGYFMLITMSAGPFIWSLPVRFLVQHPQELNVYCLSAIGLLNVIGYVMMFGAMFQKAQFRKNPHDPALAHLDRIPTPNGKGLLCGGWWSLCRKPNYLGDIIQTLSWSLPCGFDYAIPYFLPVFVALVLVDRQRQDERSCRVKHGAAWDRYCQRVKYRLIPKIF